MALKFKQLFSVGVFVKETMEEDEDLRSIMIGRKRAVVVGKRQLQRRARKDVVDLLGSMSQDASAAKGMLMQHSMRARYDCNIPTTFVDTFTGSLVTNSGDIAGVAAHGSETDEDSSLLQAPPEEADMRVLLADEFG